MPHSETTRAFQLIGGHPAVDLVNTLDWRFRETGPEELLSDYQALLRFAGQSGLMDSTQVTQSVHAVSIAEAATTLERIRALREAAADVFYSVVDGRTPHSDSIGLLDRMLKEARESQHLFWESGRLRWGWPAHIHGPGKAAELPVWMLAISVGRLLVSDAMCSIRACANPECRWLFLDSSKNHTRRWCDMKICGNRIKARRFKAKTASSD